MLEFFSPELQKESPCLTLRSAEALNPVSVGLCTAPAERTFDLYRHVRAWENL